MILTTTLRTKGPDDKVVITQKVSVKCDVCEHTYESTILNQQKKFKKYKRDLCRSCCQKEQYSLGLRDKQINFIKNYASEFQKGKTYEEMYGNEISQIRKKEISDRMSTDNPRWSLKYRTEEEIEKQKEINRNSSNPFGGIKGKSYEEIYGKEKSEKIKDKLSKKMSGENNHMYGKPSPKKSGNGWSGYYKNLYFRSLLELSFILKMENDNVLIESAEKQKFKIEYKINGSTKNYFPDFYLPKEDILVEVKPKHLINSFINKLKFNEAKRKFNFKVITEDDLIKINVKELKELIDKKILKLDNKYQIKFNEKFKPK